MSQPRLRIAFSSCFFHSDPLRPIFKGKTLQYLEQSIGQWVMGRGALAYLIPSAPEKGPLTLHDLVADFDGLVLQGGSDVSPKHYGETPLKPEWAGDYIRDLYEIELVKLFQSMKKPVLGICRGAQLINVALGGSLYQDIATQLPGSLDHRNWEIYDRNFHDVIFEPGSDLSKWYPGKTRAKINTIHHQALREIGKGLVVEAKAPDGMVEAVRNADSSIYAVQWHPEFMDGPLGLNADRSDHELLDCQPILSAFLERCERARNK